MAFEEINVYKTSRVKTNCLVTYMYMHLSGSQFVWFQKTSYLPQEKVTVNCAWCVRVCEYVWWIWKESMKLNILLEFPDGWVGGEMAKTRRTSVGGVWMFPGTTDIIIL